jgi:hypothetical protein
MGTARALAMRRRAMYESRMKKERASWLLLVVVAAVAAIVSCGPSAAQVKTAREARYKGDPATLYAAVKAATESDYKIAVSDDAAFMLRTEGRWFTPDGQVDKTRGRDISRLQENSINFVAIVRLIKADDAYTVSVEPVAQRIRGLSSTPEPLDMKDPSVPGWVHGKVDSLQLAIHERLKGYAVAGASVPAMVPPAPPPSAGSAAPEAAPSAPAPAPAPTP